MHLTAILFLSTLLSHVHSAPANASVGDVDDKPFGTSLLTRGRRYLSLGKRYKLNRRYQECVAVGETQGHCKHAVFCPANVFGPSTGSLEYLCVIEKTHVGVCCPDDIILPQVRGAQTVRDLPGGGESYDADDNRSGCGLSSLARSIVNASASQRWPWMTALLNVRLERPHFCGGALITDHHVLTAAHCFNNVDRADVRVRLGEYDFREANETRHRDYKIRQLIVHPEFEQATYDNDIAIVALDAPTTFGSYVWPICLPPSSSPPVDYTNRTAVVAGWGQQFYAGPTSEVLLEVSMPVWEHRRCVDAFVQRIAETNICAAGYEGEKDSCLGDSGGSLLYELPNKRWVTIGIVSWGIGCGNVGQPGVYTRVDKFLPWILRSTLAK